MQVDAPADLVVWDCNCSICAMKRNTHFIVPSTRFHLHKDSQRFLSCYQFNTKVAKVRRNRFCLTRLPTATCQSDRNLYCILLCGTMLSTLFCLPELVDFKFHNLRISIIQQPQVIITFCSISFVECAASVRFTCRDPIQTALRSPCIAWILVQ